MDRRVRERRRLISRERGRRRAGLIFLCVLAVGAVVAFLWLRSSDAFAVRTVEAPITRHVTEAQIADAVAPARGVSLLKVSTSAIEKTLRTFPYVRDIRVYRKFPNALEIRLEEYEPVARVRNVDGKVWLMADNGRLLERVASGESSTLPLVVAAAQFEGTPGATGPAAIVAALPVAVMLRTPEVAAALPTVEQISLSARGEVVVGLDGGLELRLGAPTDLKQKMTVAAAIIEEYLRDGKTLEYVDASAADRVAVKAE